MGEALGLAFLVGCGWPGAMAATSRKRSWAVCLTVSTRSPLVGPGISTTMLSLPWVPTSDSATPLPLTRWSMMPRASSRFAGVMSWPLAVLAFSVMRVPPCRSRPSFGFHTPPNW